MVSQKITEISVTPIPAYFPHEIGRNARNAGHGISGIEWLVRATTEGGIEGLTIANAFMSNLGEHSVEDLMKLLKEVFLGIHIDDLLEISDGRVVKPKPNSGRAFRQNGWMSILAYDLAGRELGVSAIDLLGGKVRDRVPAYDTTLYFQDLRNPDHLNNGIASIVDEAKEAHSLGYRQMKIKVGRGGRWMSPAFGAQRDADVVNSIRAAVGPETILYVDANFGYKNRLDLLEFFIKETLPANLGWLEEMIPPSLEKYKEIRRIQERLGSSALLVCGEVDRDPISYVYMDMAEEGVFDGYQPDIVSQGFSRWKQIETQLSGTNVVSQPHCFGNGNFGTRAALIYGASCEGFISLEDERIAPNVYQEDEFIFKNGNYVVADAAGLGLNVDKEIFQRKYSHNEEKIVL